MRHSHFGETELLQYGYNIDNMDNRLLLFILTLSISLYNVGTIWAMEVDIFRSWKLIEPGNFQEVQFRHWKKLPYWIFIPVGLALIGSLIMIWYHPDHSPGLAICISVGSQVLSLFLTAIFWGRWQAALSKDPLGSKSPYLDKILKTHWIRTSLITVNGVTLVVWLTNMF